MSRRLGTGEGSVHHKVVRSRSVLGWKVSDALRFVSQGGVKLLGTESRVVIWCSSIPQGRGKGSPGLHPAPHLPLTPGSFALTSKLGKFFSLPEENELTNDFNNCYKG